MLAREPRARFLVAGKGTRLVWLALAALLCSPGLGGTTGWAAPGWAAHMSSLHSSSIHSPTPDLFFDPKIDAADAPDTWADTGWLMQPHTPLSWPQQNLNPASRHARASDAATNLPASWTGKAFSLTQSSGAIQKTFDVGVKGLDAASTNDLGTLTDTITVYGKFSLAHPLPHHPSIKLGESIHLSKTGMNWAGGLGLSVHWDDGLTLYGDASVQGSLLDIDVKDLSAHIGVRYEFL